MKTNKLMRVASVLLIVVLLSAYAVSGNFARYASSTTGSDTANIAKWDFEIGDPTETTGFAKNTFEFNLFNTVYAQGSTEEYIFKNPTNEKLIAPGTRGGITIEITNKSQVNATYKVAFSQDDAGVPLQYSDGSKDASGKVIWKDQDAINEWNIDTPTTIGMGETKSFTLYWRWLDADNETKNEADTALGLEGTAAPKVTATVTVKQVD